MRITEKFPMISWIPLVEKILLPIKIENNGRIRKIKNIKLNKYKIILITLGSIIWGSSDFEIDKLNKGCLV